MDKAQFEKLNNFKSERTPTIIKYTSFSYSNADRTLMYGYDTDRNTHHVYLKAGFVHKVIYSNNTMISHQLEFGDLQDIVPNKRIYPEACDFEFCTWMLESKIALNFTSWDDERATKREIARHDEDSAYFGKTV